MKFVFKSQKGTESSAELVLVVYKQRAVKGTVRQPRVKMADVK